MKLTPEEFAEFTKNLALIPQRLKPGFERAADKGGKILKKDSPVDLGDYKDGWERRFTPTGVGATDIQAQLVNESPVAGIIERGARPHGISREGLERIYMWVRRKINPQGFKTKRRAPLSNYNDPETWRIVFAIAHKIKTQGQQPMWVVRKKLLSLGDLAGTEVESIILKELRNRK